VKNEYGWDGYDLSDDYITLESVRYKPREWSTCPKCNAKPKVWLFDNGKFAACKCFGFYDEKVRAESVNSYAHRNAMKSYRHTNLRDNWNSYIEDGKIVEYKGGRW